MLLRITSPASLSPSISAIEGLDAWRASAKAARVNRLVVTAEPLSSRLLFRFLRSQMRADSNEYAFGRYAQRPSRNR